MHHQNRWRQAIDFVSKVKIAQHFAGTDSMEDLISASLNKSTLVTAPLPIL